MTMLMSSCTILRVKPIEKDLQTRINEFPISDIPLEHDATIRWNQYQIPFIKADSDRDAALLLGMVHAHLRLGQMYMFREVVNHRLSKHIGPFGRSIDHSLMAMDLFAAVPEIESKMDSETKAWIVSFVQGINLYQERLKDLPVELKLLSLEPSPWSTTDIIKIGRMISADVNWFSWFSYLKLQDEPGWDQFWDKILAGGGESINSSDNALSQMFRGMSKSGSNAFVISGAKSSENSAIMASDPHLGLMIPNMWLLAGIHSPSYHVVGLMFPALPMVLVGRNEDISFSGTNMRSASSDLYELTPAEQKQITTTERKIEVKGWFDRKVKLRHHPIGPIISDAPLFKSNGRVIAMKWVGHQHSDELSAALKMNRARNWQEFVLSFEDYAVSGQNYLYADTKGNIGLLPAVKIPIRNYTVPTEVVYPSDDESKAWQGFLHPGELPNIYNPVQGFIASANNSPVEAQTPLGFFFSSNDRISRLNEYLGSRELISREDISTLHLDTYVESSYLAAKALARAILQHQNSLPGSALELADQLSNWDGYYETDSKAALIYQLLLSYFSKAYYDQLYDKVFVERLRSSDKLETHLSKDLETANPSIVLISLQKAIPQTIRLSKKFDNWGEMHRLSINHTLGMIPVVGRRFRFAEYPVGGSSNSLMKTAHSLETKRHRSTYGANSRFYSVMNDPNENYFVLMGGQDGWVGSANMIDQVPLWQNGQYIRIPLEWSAVEKEFTYETAIPRPAK